jgi:hypothetical protein
MVFSKDTELIGWYETLCYRTQNKNVFIEYIQDLTGDNGQTKKRNSELKFNYPTLVESIRLLSNL